MALAAEYQQCAYLTARYDEAESVDPGDARPRSHQLGEGRDTVDADPAILHHRQDGGVDQGRDNGLVAPWHAHHRQSGPRRDRARDRRGRAQFGWAADRRFDSAPPMSDPAQIQAVRLLMEIFPAAFLSGSGNLFPFLVLKSVNISFRSGNSPELAFAYAAYGMLLCGALDDPALGYEFGKLAVAMNDRFDDIALKSRIIYVYAMFILHWSEHWSSMTPWFRRGIEAGYQSGDLLYLAYSAQDCIIWDPKLDLETAALEHAKLPDHRSRLRVSGLARFGHAVSANAAQFPRRDRQPMLDERRRV